MAMLAREELSGPPVVKLSRSQTCFQYQCVTLNKFGCIGLFKF